MYRSLYEFSQHTCSVKDCMEGVPVLGCEEPSCGDCCCCCWYCCCCCWYCCCCWCCCWCCRRNMCIHVCKCVFMCVSVYQCVLRRRTSCTLIHTWGCEYDCCCCIPYGFPEAGPETGPILSEAKQRESKRNDVWVFRIRIYYPKRDRLWLHPGPDHTAPVGIL